MHPESQKVIEYNDDYSEVSDGSSQTEKVSKAKLPSNRTLIQNIESPNLY